MDGSAPATALGRAAAARKLRHVEAEAEKARGQVAAKDKQLQGLQVRVLLRRHPPYQGYAASQFACHGATVTCCGSWQPAGSADTPCFDRQIIAKTLYQLRHKM